MYKGFYSCVKPRKKLKILQVFKNDNMIIVKFNRNVEIDELENANYLVIDYMVCSDLDGKKNMEAMMNIRYIKLKGNKIEYVTC